MKKHIKLTKQYNADGNGYKWVDGRSKAEIEKDIIEEIKSVSCYNGYALVKSIKFAIARAMYDWDHLEFEYKDTTNIEKIYSGMVKRNMFYFSKYNEDLAKLR